MDNATKLTDVLYILNGVLTKDKYEADVLEDIKNDVKKLLLLLKEGGK